MESPVAASGITERRRSEGGASESAASGRIDRRALGAVLIGWLAARVLVGVSFLVAHLLSGHVRLPDGRTHLDQGLLTWDGDIYRAIAEHGYAGQAREIVRFFPLYPLLGRAAGWVLGGRPDIALVLLTNLGALIAGYLLWQVAAARTGSVAVADRVVVLANLWPAGLCLVFAYSEGVFLALVVGVVLLVMRKHPLLAIPLLVLAGLIRPTGVLLAVVVAVAAIGDLRSAPEPSRWDLRRVAPWATAILAPFAGLGVYLWWLQATLDDGAGPFRIQGQLRAGWREPVTRSIAAVGHLFTGDFRDVYNVAFAVALIALAVVAVRDRQPAAWSSYLIVGLAVALSANNIDSIGRYGMMLAPAWALALGSLSARRWAYVTMLMASAVGFVWFTVLALLGLVIP